MSPFVRWTLPSALLSLDHRFRNEYPFIRKFVAMFPTCWNDSRSLPVGSRIILSPEDLCFMQSNNMLMWSDACCRYTFSSWPYGPLCHISNTTSSSEPLWQYSATRRDSEDGKMPEIKIFSKKRPIAKLYG